MPHQLFVDYPREKQDVAPLTLTRRVPGRVQGREHETTLETVEIRTIVELKQILMRALRCNIESCNWVAGFTVIAKVDKNIEKVRELIAAAGLSVSFERTLVGPAESHDPTAKGRAHHTHEYETAPVKKVAPHIVAEPVILPMNAPIPDAAESEEEIVILPIGKPAAVAETPEVKTAV